MFAPVVMLAPFATLDEAIEMSNVPEYSLHAGIFTNNLSVALEAAKRMEAGGVMINDSSDYRFDAMPFGGSNTEAWEGRASGSLTKRRPNPR
ncbi:hypothetical protein MESS4_330075 [Mesorhizobium sp. STM 4661]|nr:hypothetical protein MESS4_330075 [Mesorhizobium sp. STM 4661]